MSEPVVAEIAISRGTYLKGLLFRLGIFAPLIVAQAVLATNDNSLPAWVFATVIGAGLVIGGIAVARMVRRVQVTAGGIRLVRVLGERVIGRDQLAYGIYARRYHQSMSQPSPHLILLGHNNKRLATISGQLFSTPDLNRLTKEIASLARIDVIDDPVLPADVAARHPGVLRLWERRPTLVGFLIALAIIVVVSVLAFALIDN